MNKLSTLSVLILNIASLVFAPAALANKYGCCQSVDHKQTTVACTDASGSQCGAKNGCGGCAKNVKGQVKKIF